MLSNKELLDELMGKDRNGDLDRRKVLKLGDKGVCPYFLRGLCPYLELEHTKASHEVGVCSDQHPRDLKEEFDRLPDRQKEYYSSFRGWQRVLERIVADCDRRIDRSQMRLIENQKKDDNAGFGIEIGDVSPEVKELAEKIQSVLREAGKKGEEGDVDESLRLFSEAEELQRQLEELKKQPRISAVSAQYAKNTLQELKACEVCGALLNCHDSAVRLADHYSGKMHRGFKAIREKVEELRIATAAAAVKASSSSIPPPPPPPSRGSSSYEPVKFVRASSQEPEAGEYHEDRRARDSRDLRAGDNRDYRGDRSSSRRRSRSRSRDRSGRRGPRDGYDSRDRQSSRDNYDSRSRYDSRRSREYRY